MSDLRVTAASSDFLGGAYESAWPGPTVALIHPGLEKESNDLQMAAFRRDCERRLALIFRGVSPRTCPQKQPNDLGPAAPCSLIDGHEGSNSR